MITDEMVDIAVETWFNSPGSYHDSMKAALKASIGASGCSLVPKTPTDGVLMSMSLRYDHGLGFPGYYDSKLFKMAGSYPVSHADRLRGTITTMRQLYEEVVGEGYYSIDKELEYASKVKSMLNIPKENVDEKTQPNSEGVENS